MSPGVSPHDRREPPHGRRRGGFPALRPIALIERMVVAVLLIMLVITVLIGAIELGVIVYEQILQPPVGLLSDGSMIEIFGFFLMVLLGLELLETVKAYMAEGALHVEVVMLVAIVAVSRKVVLLDKDKWAPEMVVSIALVILGLSIGYYLVKGAIARHGTTPHPTPGSEGGAGKVD